MKCKIVHVPVLQIIIMWVKSLYVAHVLEMIVYGTTGNEHPIFWICSYLITFLSLCKAYRDSIREERKKEQIMNKQRMMK